MTLPPTPRGDSSSDDTARAGPSRRIGFLLGPLALVAVLVIPAPAGLTPDGWRTAGVALWMAAWWVTEAIPIPATALLPLALFPMLGVVDMKTAAEPYANDLVFLQMGGFLLAVAMSGCGLHKRIALGVVARVGTAPSRLVLGFMLASAFVSMWISNTATTAMMLPIAIAVGTLFRGQDEQGPYELGICLMLGIAYAATLGGVCTLIGTPPNAVLAAAASEILGRDIGFLEWMAVGLPITIVFLPIVWLLLTRWAFPLTGMRGDASDLVAGERRKLGTASRTEVTVAVIFCITAFGWLMRSEKTIGSVTVPGLETLMPELRDSTIAIVGALLLFVVPVDWRRRRAALDWETARRIPWGVLVLFGGGLSLARAMSESGLAEWVGASVADLDAMPTWLLLLTIAALFVFLTEITSNVATATMAMPIMAGAAFGLGIEPLVLMATAALSSSMAFMLPVATPPNAIVFGSGYLTIPQMVRAGFVCNLVAIVMVTLAATFLVPLLAGG